MGDAEQESTIIQGHGNMKSEQLSLKSVALLLYYWVCLGFFLGTLVLMGPVRWLANCTPCSLPRWQRNLARPRLRP